VYRVRVIKHFSSCHNLRNYEGKCENLHGHNWKVEAYLSGEQLDETEMLVDFKILKRELKEILEELDHAYLNELEYFKKYNTTSENIARYIYEKLKNKFGTLTEKVVVWESHEQSAEYFE